MTLPRRTHRDRSYRSPYIKAVRPIVKSDLESMRQRSARERITTLRDVHHIMARLFVSGLSTSEVAAEVGYTISRVSNLRNSPAMEELIARYRADVHEGWKETAVDDLATMTRNRRKALRVIEDYLDDHEITPVPLIAALKIHDSLADRDGHHRKTATQNTNINFAVELEAAYSRSREARLLDITPSKEPAE